MSIGEQWKAALEGLSIRHQDRDCRVSVIVTGDQLAVSVIGAVDTVTDLRLEALNVSTVGLTYFPGPALARMWLAAAWAGYMQHEALELVTCDGKRPIDPHVHVEFDRGLRRGFPVSLTPQTLLETLCLVMPAEIAAREVHDHHP